MSRRIDYGQLVRNLFTKMGGQGYLSRAEIKIWGGYKYTIVCGNNIIIIDNYNIIMNYKVDRIWA